MDSLSSNPDQDEAGAMWLPVATIATRLNVSARAVQKRCASGTLPARRVPGARGEVWEVRANGERELSANLRPSVRPQNAAPTTNDGERRTFESERERELKEEVRFLRNTVEQLQRDAIELRAIARDALKIAPRQLAAAPDATAINRQQDTQSGAPDNMPVAIQTAPELDALELLELCRRISR